MSQKLLDDLKSDISSSHPKVGDRVASMLHVIADRVASLGGDAVKASDLATTLRMDPDSIGALIATDPPVVDLAPATTNPVNVGMRDASDPVPVKPTDTSPQPATASSPIGSGFSQSSAPAPKV